jgi:hypothetical protein
VAPREPGPVFIFCAPGLFLGGTEGVGARFHVLRSRTLFGRYRGHRVPFSCFALSHSFRAVPLVSGTVFKFYAPGLVFDGTEGVGARFHVLHSKTLFGRYRGRRVPFSCFALPDSFRAVLRASGTVFKFCALENVISGTKGFGAHFHVLRYRTRFWRYRGRWVPFSCFALPDTFSALPRAPDPVFMFCAPGLIFDDSEDLGSCWHILHSRTCLWR